MQTPLTPGTWAAARAAASVAYTAAQCVLGGTSPVYALCRPPGHHAGRAYYGGYCYLNNAALAARCLAGSGRVAILDIDYHHGNGTQDIFYEEDQVLFVSIHGDGNRCYPYFWGYTDETGRGKGKGANLNLPLPLGAEEDAYMASLAIAVEAIKHQDPSFLVVSLGADTHRRDPLGRFELETRDFERIGRRIGRIGTPTLVVQEGGYNLSILGESVAAFLQGLMS
jgi:acetoin utilization deacetylase AcuC-like enzyme